MSNRITDGLSRLQNQSRIPATTWRHWCNLLDLDPVDAVDVWEGICHPIMVATRKVPEVPYILQLRAARLELDIFDFKEEVPKVLHITAFLYALKDERMTGGKARSALLKFYRKSALQIPPDQAPGLFVQKFIVDLCAVVLVAKVLPSANITLASVLKPVVEGHGNIEQIIGLGLKVLADKPYADKVRQCLEERENAANNPLPEPDELSAEDAEEDAEEDGDDGDDYGETEEAAADTADEYAASPAEDAEDDYESDAGEEEYDDGDDYGEVEGDSLEVYLARFKNALHAIYGTEAKVESEGGEEEDEALTEKNAAQLAARLKAIALFKPLQAMIPSDEEAALIAQRAEAKCNRGTVRKPVLAAGPSAGDGAAAAGGDMPMVAVIKGGAGKSAARGEGVAKPGERAHGDVEGSVDVAANDMVEPEDVSLPELSDKAHEIGQLLAALEPNDRQAWVLLIDPHAHIQSPSALARQICSVGTGLEKAYADIKQIARYIKLKDLLNTSNHKVRRDRNFAIELRTFINSLNNHRKFDSNSPQLAPLGRILDHAAAALVRLEALKTNFNFSTEYPDSYNRETVTLYYEEALRGLTDLVDVELRGQAREKADADSDVLLAAFRAEQFVEKLLQTVRTYMTAMRDKGATKSVAEFNIATIVEPIEFEDVEEGTPLGPVPDDLLVTDDMGEVFAAACAYVLEKSWQVMQEVHHPLAVAERIIDVLREVLVVSAVFTPAMWRHEENSSLGLAVVSLDKVTGNRTLQELYVRLRSSGQLAFIEGFEDGNFIDLFEIREYKPSRVRAAVKKEQEDEGTEPLQTGHKYLYTVGRTDKLFAKTPNDLISGCIRAEGGGPKVFNVF